MSHMSHMLPTLNFASRSSPLARAQVKECLTSLLAIYPLLQARVTYVETYGDRDLGRSLREMGQTDFFTREVDDLVLSGVCDVALHSAKDLPSSLPKGLLCIALTRCVDPTDSLVMRPGDTLVTLPRGARIATSSLRREEAVLQLRPDCVCIDVRGPIADRLAYLTNGLAEGVVIAHAALLRLGLGSRPGSRPGSLNYVTLPGSTTPLQGQLALVAKETRQDLQELVACLDVRKLK